jgi:hypothetical protein
MATRKSSIRKSLEDRLLARVAIPADVLTGCWLWTGSHNGMGYGQIEEPTPEGRRGRLTHRLVWAMVNGPIPHRMFLCHRCDVPLCCNPAHLFPGTQADNMADMVAKGRSAKGDRSPLRVNPHAVRRGAASNFSKLTEDDVRQIRRLHEQGVATAALAERFGVASHSVCRVVSRTTWSNVE